MRRNLAWKTATKSDACNPGKFLEGRAAALDEYNRYFWPVREALATADAG
jgi:hypothetical protein